MAPPSVTKVQQNLTLYTELRANANELLNYVAFPSSGDMKSAISTANKTLGINQASSNFNELLLSSNEPIPLYREMSRLYDEKVESRDPDEGLFLINEIMPFSSSINELNSKTVSLVYHKDNALSSYTTNLTDVSALFCSLIPTAEMSLCVPYFDVRIIYPNDNSSITGLDVLKFVGRPSTSNVGGYQAADVNSKYGFNVVGMEIFSLPQTLIASSRDLEKRYGDSSIGVQILDPLQPLLTIENASIQQIGIGGGLNTQSKIDLKLTLHDRSRLSDIEVLTSSTFFPQVTLRITHGWHHPDTNKMTKNVYAKLLNSMRVSQDYSISSVSLNTKNSASLNVNLSLIGAGSLNSKNAKIISALGEVIPYTALTSLLRQFIMLKSKTVNSAPGSQAPDVSFSKIGTTITATVSSAASSKKFIDAPSFYRIYDRLKTKITDEKLQELLDELSKITPQEGPTEKFGTLFSFENATEQSGYGNLKNPIITQEMLPTKLQTTIDEFSKANNLIDQSGRSASVVPVAELVAQLVAKPLLISQPDIEEVRIHCFSFNSACGLMAGENIGNFPIVKSKFVEYKEPDAKERKLNLNTTAEAALNLIIKHINSPSSPYYGFSTQYTDLQDAIKQIKEGNGTEEEIADKLQSKNAEVKAKIDQQNQKYLADKQIVSDTAFIPARVKSSIEVLPAYTSANDRYDPKNHKKIARIVLYDERCGDFNKLGNLIFSMINSNSIASINPDQAGEMSSFGTSVNGLFDNLDSGDDQARYILRDKKRVRQIASTLYPSLIIGSEGTLITNASYTAAPSGEIQSAFLLTALQEQDGSSAGAGSDSPLLDDVFILPATVTLTMMGNVCIARGQTYYIDFNTDTTLDNTYTVTSVSHTISPGSFTTTATLAPVHSASMRSVERQLKELSLRVQRTYGLKSNVLKKSFENSEKLKLAVEQTTTANTDNPFGSTTTVTTTSITA